MLESSFSHAHDICVDPKRRCIPPTWSYDGRSWVFHAVVPHLSRIALYCAARFFFPGSLMSSMPSFPPLTSSPPPIPVFLVGCAC